MLTRSYTLVIPVYNEAKRLGPNLEKIFNFFADLQLPVEVIFACDGSTDDTLKLLREYQQKHTFQIIDYKDNMGKGYAVRQGALAATGDWIVFFDIDLATPLAEFHQLLSHLEDGADLIIGSRRLEKSQIKKSESAIRVFLGRGFTGISNLLVPGITDFTCGFKCFSQVAAKEIFSKARINRWGFDTEVLYIAKLKKFKILQIPVSWSHDDDSRVKVGSAVISSLKELWQIKLNQLRGYYD